MGNDNEPRAEDAAVWWPASDLIPWADNPNQHDAEQVEELRQSIRSNGFGRTVVAHWPSRRMIAGHGTLLAVLAEVRDDEAWQLAGAPSPGLIPVRFRHEPWEEFAESLALADNKTAERSQVDDQVLQPVLARIEARRAAGGRVGFHGYRVAEVTRHLRRHRRPVPPDQVQDPGPSKLPKRAKSRRGEVYELGPHRLVCGDSTDEQAQTKLFGGLLPDVVLTDPPYCSGGFQESGKAAGSVGTRGDEMIARDTLSTRGYQALMRRVLTLTPAGVVYVFTDWRMWVNLWDIVEACGYGVRNMVVWDKGTPGMGVGWRHQHELIMAAVAVKAPFDPKLAQGNVLDVDAEGLLLKAKRTGNRLHATEKPVDLCRVVLEVTDLCQVVHDPFAGSGPTLIAAAQTGRVWRGMELSPGYCDVTRRRWTTWAEEAGVEPGKGALE